MPKNIQDVQLEKRTAIVKGKGKKIRHIHFSEECALVMKEYLATRSGDPEEPLFKNKFGQRLAKSGIYDVTTKLGKQAGLIQSLHPHCCRHTFAGSCGFEYDSCLCTDSNRRYAFSLSK